MGRDFEVIIQSDAIDSYDDKKVREFLDKILGHGEAMITDRSWISDFIDVSLEGTMYEAAKRRIWRSIQEKYGVDVTGEVELVAIFAKIWPEARH